MISALNPHADLALYRLLSESYQRLAGSPLVPPAPLALADGGAEWLYREAPFGLLAHDGAADPRFIYANRAAQACFEYSWGEIVGMASRLSAGPADRAERQRLLDAVRREGLVRGYRGLRIAKSGRSFLIEDGIIWQLTDEGGIERGQAALFYVRDSDHAHSNDRDFLKSR